MSPTGTVRGDFRPTSEIQVLAEVESFLMDHDHHCGAGQRFIDTLGNTGLDDRADLTGRHLDQSH
jgi:hypothetical protein